MYQSKAINSTEMAEISKIIGLVYYVEYALGLFCSLFDFIVLLGNCAGRIQE